MTDAPGAGREEIFEVDLHGYMDAELPAERRSQVESYLATHPNHAARIAEFGALTLSLHRLYGGGQPTNPCIEALTEELFRALRRRRARRLIRIAAGAMVLVAGAGIASGLTGRFGPGTAEDRFVTSTRQATGAKALFVGQPRRDPSSADALDEAKNDPSPLAPGSAGAKEDDAGAEPGAAPVPESMPTGMGRPKET